MPVSTPVVVSEAPPQSRRAVWAFLRNVWDTAKVFIVSLAIIVPFRAYVAQPFFVRGASMEPTFDDGEYLVVDELSYTLGLRPPQRGDVVVFRYPLDPSQYFIKRIVGLPGETVRVREGTVSVASAQFPGGVVVDESTYLLPTEATEGTVEAHLGPGEFFILGDNRNHSSDSRAWGPLKRELIVGRAWVRVFPLRHAGVVQTPWYGSLTEVGAETSGAPATAPAQP